MIPLYSVCSDYFDLSEGDAYGEKGHKENLLFSGALELLQG
jgi:hypothetical protein